MKGSTLGNVESFSWGGSTVLFQEHSAEDYGGEGVVWYKAFISDGMSEVPVFKEASFDDLRAFYKTLEFKTEKVKFWIWMREFNPAYVARREAEMAQDAWGRNR